MSDFFSMILRMKYINRWGLMRNTFNENLSQHSMDVAMIAHCLAVIGNVRFGRTVDANFIAVLGLFHDVSEIITGDMPTPVKYFDEKIKAAYKEVEAYAKSHIFNLLPDDLKIGYEKIMNTEKDEYTTKIIRAADKFSAYIKCIDEEKAGNSEFSEAKKMQLEAIKNLNLPEAEVFFEEFMPGFEMSLDEMNMKFTREKEGRNQNEDGCNAGGVC